VHSTTSTTEDPDPDEMHMTFIIPLRGEQALGACNKRSRDA
jgi:hypothetical protein